MHMVPQSNEIIGERTSTSPQKQSAAPANIQQDSSHPLVGKLTLLARLLSGNPCRAREFRRTLSTSLCHPGGNQRSVSMEHICRSGRTSICSRRSVDPISPTINQVLEILLNFTKITVDIVH